MSRSLAFPVCSFAAIARSESLEQPIDAIVGGRLLAALALLGAPSISGFPLEGLADLLDLRVGEMLDADEIGARLGDGTKQLVQFGLDRGTVAILAVLDQKHHQEGYD